MFLSCCAEGFANFAMRKIVLLKQLLFNAILLRKNPPMDSSFTDDDVPLQLSLLMILPTPHTLIIIRCTLKAVTVSILFYGQFIEQLNHIWSCVTPGCMVISVKVSSVGLGGAVV